MIKPVSWTLGQVKRLNDTIWHTPLSKLSRRKTFLIKQLRIIVIAARGFAHDKVQLRASALTFYTLLSIIPVLAIGLAIAKGFGLDQDLESLITTSKEFQNYSDFLSPILERARLTVQETRGGYIAGVGVIILFWSVISLLGQIESSFNHIWQIKSSRAWYRKFTDYLTIMLIAPVFLIISSSISVFVGTELSDFIERAPILAFFKPVVSFLIKFAPFLITWMILTVLYIVMPNTKVKFYPALVSGIITGTALQFLQWLYVDLQVGIAKLNAIYGTLAALPLLILLMQACWTTVLLGAELSFANQNISRYEYESDALNVSNYHRRALVLMIMHMIIRNFSIGETPVSAGQVVKTLKIPVRLANDLLQDLTNAELLSEIHKNEEKERLYQPGLDINKLTVSFVLSRLDKMGTEHKSVNKNKEYDAVITMLDRFDKLISRSDYNKLIKDL
jgi:membrane protein